MTKRNKSCESEVMLTMQRKELLKKSAIRYAEYYGMLAKAEYGETLLKLSRDNDTNHSIEFCDNRLSRFVASKGKCELSKVSLAFEDVECIYLNPPNQGGTDEYANLRIVHKDIKSLIYSNDVKIIKSLIDLFDCRAPAKIAKLNKWRAKAGLEAINLITINQTLK